MTLPHLRQRAAICIYALLAMIPLLFDAFRVERYRGGLAGRAERLERPAVKLGFHSPRIGQIQGNVLLSLPFDYIARGKIIILRFRTVNGHRERAVLGYLHLD